MNSLLDNYSLSAAWYERNRINRANSLQSHNDVLFDLVMKDVHANLTEINRRLRIAIMHATAPVAMSIPIWSFRSTQYLRPPAEIPHYDDVVEDIRESGCEWFVGLTGVDEESDEWDDVWRDTPATVFEVIRHTDFLERLAIEIDAKHVRIDLRPDPAATVYETEYTRTRTYELRLHYYPKNLPDWVVERRAEVEADYKHYVSPHLAIGEQVVPHLWRGHLIMSTPPPRSPASSPPPVARSNRCYCCADE